MQDEYSLAQGEHYGRRLAARLCQQHFGPQPDATLDGAALLKFTPVRQLNLLVLRQLLGRWQQEAQNLRSPYFDFEAEAVRAALTQFMNVLSRHIRLDRAALEPLLAQAAADALLLAARPAQAFERLLLPADADEPVRAAQLRDSLRYVDQDKAYYQSFIDSLPADDAPLGRELLTQRFAQYQAKNPAPADALPRLVAALSALLPVSEADLRDAPAKPAPAAPAPTPAKPVAIAVPVPPVAVAPAAAPVSPPAAAPPAAPTPAGVPLYEKLKATQPATPHLAETLRHSAQGSAAPLAERSAPKVASLRDAISINQRFSFINELFGGENMEYHAAIQHLDALPTADAALAYVRQELAQKYDWSRKEEHVGKLLKLIERKFATA
ncbi:MAG TPA: hypothetical protein VFO93_06740 [Hymenobacter sp.]|uniref:hypothetical protein n=1 Tax=Hymenobacter sp. TaxID=1898978 RepID=UPI002D7F20BC|nr:hypothetical protein [Hymenobacter sp.]HET9503219.1 hypothetical protein [Hymenobacter sp.]